MYLLPVCNMRVTVIQPPGLTCGSQGIIHGRSLSSSTSQMLGIVTPVSPGLDRVNGDTADPGRTPDIWDSRISLLPEFSAPMLSLGFSPSPVAATTMGVETMPI